MDWERGVHSMGGGATEDLTWSYRSLQGLLYIGIGGRDLKRTVIEGWHRSETRWHDKPSVKGNIQSGSQSRQIRVLILSPGRSPRSPSFPTASETGVPDTHSVLAFKQCARYFLLFNILVGRFPELTPVRSQATGSWLSAWV